MACVSRGYDRGNPSQTKPIRSTVVDALGQRPGAFKASHRSAGQVFKTMKEDVSTAIGESLAGIVLVVLIGFGVVAAWDGYFSEIRPLARVVPTFTPTAIPDPERAKVEGRRTRQIIDYLGAANAFRAAGQREWAIDRYREVLAIDPGNLDARAGLRDLGAIVPTGSILNTPVPTPLPIEPTNTPTKR